MTSRLGGTGLNNVTYLALCPQAITVKGCLHIHRLVLNVILLFILIELVLLLLLSTSC